MDLMEDVVEVAEIHLDVDPQASRQVFIRKPGLDVVIHGLRRPAERRDPGASDREFVTAEVRTWRLHASRHLIREKSRSTARTEALPSSYENRMTGG